MSDHACTLPPEPASVAAARRHVERVLDEWGLVEPAWTCLQLISELATNAVIHARTEFTVEVTRHEDVLRVCVRDSSPAVAGVRRYSEQSTTGRGLRLVESMAAGWGVEGSTFGKTIWFQIDLSRRGTAVTWDDASDVDLDALLEDFADDDDTGPAGASVRAWQAWPVAA